jgi:hypothetical protein
VFFASAAVEEDEKRGDKIRKISYIFFLKYNFISIEKISMSPFSYTGSLLFFNIVEIYSESCVTDTEETNYREKWKQSAVKRFDMG